MALPQKRCVRDGEWGGGRRLACPGSVEPGHETFCEAGFLKARADLLEPTVLLRVVTLPLGKITLTFH